MKEKMKSGIIVLAGITLVAIAISMFLVPNKIVNGGSSGLATSIYYTVGLKPSIANALINGVLLIFAFIYFRKNFVTKTLLRDVADMMEGGVLILWKRKIQLKKSN